MKNYYLLFILFIGIGNLSAQNAEKVFEQYIQAKNRHGDYQADMTMAVYKGTEGTIAYEKVTGMIASYKKTIYQSLNDMKMLVGENFYIKLNESQKLMAVGLSSNSFLSNGGAGYFDIEQLSKFFDKKEINDTKKQWELTLSLANIPNLYISKITLFIEKSSLHLKKAALYYSYASDFSKYDKNLSRAMDIPRMEIIYSDYTDKIDLALHHFKKDHYFKHKNNKIVPSKKFRDYEIVLLK